MIENKGINLNLQDKTPFYYLYLNPSVTMEMIQFLIDKGYLQEINTVEIEKELKLWMMNLTNQIIMEQLYYIILHKRNQLIRIFLIILLIQELIGINKM
ncbi:hypothetical protein M0811_14625 [Anaeramoeba ignava]|uniref:Uncharacterized protein n=1 Tax=Anaeramoeba ignava TaxID=1746090 RepID=A0A9Q0LXF8_ANAIG|nr:hypothetical protein M0811_14625 [Anaeramoeba ignava]